MSRYLPDRFTIAIILTVILASFVPASGRGAQVFEIITNIAVGVLFFMHGAKLSREAIVAGVTHWRLHLLVFLCTFVMFPILGLTLKPVLSWLMTPELYVGVLFLCALPSTVQSSIALTAIARGNVPAAVCSASFSSLIGIFLTPVLVSLFVVPHGGPISFEAATKIFLQLLLPFVVGHLMRPLIGNFIGRHKAALKYIDQGSILLVVYTAFSAAVIEGLWKNTPVHTLLGVIAATSILLGIALLVTWQAGKRLGFSKADQITILFCGSKKSLATGAPMAKVLFASSAVGAIVLPVMIFHQVQLMLCALIAQHYARRPDEDADKIIAAAAQP
jgi:sodium/bile acid cotransporter 7